jgi:BED zinc finger
MSEEPPSPLLHGPSAAAAASGRGKWHHIHFDRLDDGGFRCVHCGQEYGKTTSSGTRMNHLKLKHDIYQIQEAHEAMHDAQQEINEDGSPAPAKKRSRKIKDYEQHFEMLGDGGFRCILCGNEYSKNTSSGNRINHLRTKHGLFPTNDHESTLPMSEAQLPEDGDHKPVRVARGEHEQHFEKLENGGFRCIHCRAEYGKNTSSGTRITHLQTKHDLCGAVVRSKPKSAQEKTRRSRIDSAIVDYVIGAELGHSHVADASFQHFLSVLSPGYIPLSRRTVKRRLLEMYAVLKLLMMQHAPEELSESPQRSALGDRSKGKRTLESRPSLHDCTYKAEMSVRAWKHLLLVRSCPLPSDFHQEFLAIPTETLQSMADDDVIHYAIENCVNVVDLE